MRVSEHMAGLHTSLSKKDRSDAAVMRKTASKFMRQHKEAGMKPEEESTESILAAYLNEWADQRDEQADWHDAQCEECQKTTRDDLAKSTGTAMVSNRGFGIEHVRGIVPPNPTITPVLRAGQRDFTKSEVPPEFESLVETE